MSFHIFSPVSSAGWRTTLLYPAFCCALLFSQTILAHQDSACIPTAAAEATGKPINMVFGGDIVLGNSFLVDDIPKSWDKLYFAGVDSVLKQADLVFGNLEGVLTGRKDSMKQTDSGRAFAFSFPPRYADLLYREGFDIVNVANNHAYDFREEGYQDTLHNLKQAGILATGPRGQITTLSIHGLKIAMIGFTYTSKFNSVFELNQDAELVRQAKAGGAYVIVTFHAGAEGPSAIWHGNEDEIFMGENRGNEVAFAHAMIDAGADLAVGHGPHVLREAECYQGHPIVYSLGNFVGVGGLSIKKVAGISALLELSVNPDGSLRQLNLVPIRFNGRKLPRIDPAEFGTRLVNYLGQHARYRGDFIMFPVKPGAQKKFESWLSANVEVPPASDVPQSVDQTSNQNAPADQHVSLQQH